MWQLNEEPVAEKAEQKTRWSLLFWFFLVCLIYFLSVGPVWKLVSIGKLTDRVLVIYNPLAGLRLALPPVDYLYVRYMSLWGIPVRPWSSNGATF